MRLLIFNIKQMLLHSETHSHIVQGTVIMMLKIQIREVKENTVAEIHTDKPGTVHIIWIAVGI